MKKRILALMMAAVMTMSMSVTAFAAEVTNKTYTVSFEEKGKEEHTYDVYQIFAGELAEDGETLSNIKWGSSVDKEAGITIGDTQYKTAAEFAEFLGGLTDSELAQYTADIFDDLTDSFTTVKSSESKNLEAGYYLFKDVTENLGTDTPSDIMIQVINNVKITAKDGTVTSEKKVDDVNDSTGDKELLQDSADYDIGDDVPYTLTGTLPVNYDSYKSFKYVFHDTMDEGLTFNNDVKVYVVDNAADINENTETVSADLYVVDSSDHAFTVSFADLKKVVTDKSKKVVVKFTAKLNENARIGAEGNKNESHITFSNDSDVEGKTPDDTVIVFTYKVVINKVTKDAEGELIPLKGAEFTLSKLVDGKYVTVKTLDATPLDKDGNVIAEDDEITEVASYTFEFNGLDDGQYKLEETTTPDGYNTMEPVEFKVVATHTNDDAGEDALKLTDLNGNPVDGSIDLGFAEDKEAGSLTADVVNLKGSLLPSTGGMGTTVFYVIGGILVIGAGIVLFTRKRMSVEE